MNVNVSHCKTYLCRSEHLAVLHIGSDIAANEPALASNFQKSSLLKPMFF